MEKAKAKELNTKRNSSVVDVGANQVVFVRMHVTCLGSADISLNKAKTACFFDMPSRKTGKLSQPETTLFNTEHSNNRLISFPAGTPLEDKERNVTGAFGVRGNHLEHDHAVA
jgi:uncharacterized protein GlcG (DUF336 family)